MRCPASVASVSTCHRRLRSEFVRLWKRTNASPSQVTGFFRISRRPQEAARPRGRRPGAPVRELLRPAATPPTTTTKIASPMKAIVSSAAWVCRSASGARARRSGTPASPAGSRRRSPRPPAPTGAAAKPHARSIANDSAIPTAAPARRDVRRGRRRLRDDERLVEAEAGKRRHPGRRERGEVQRRRSRRSPMSRPRERLDDVPDVAVVGDPGQDEREGGDQHGDPDAAAEHLPLRESRATTRGRLIPSVSPWSRHLELDSRPSKQCPS